MNGNTLAFQPKPDLADIFDRQRQLEDLELAVAEMKYRYDAIYLGGGLLPWGILTPGQRKAFRMNAKQFLQGVE